MLFEFAVAVEENLERHLDSNQRSRHMRYILTITVLLIAGCDQRIDQLLERLSGHETNTVILIKTPTLIDSNGILLRSEQPMKVIGESSALCLVLKDRTPLAPQPVMDRIFSESMQGAALTASLRMTNGEVVALSRPGQAWAKYGHVAAGDEVSACFSCACGPRPSVGAVVADVSVKSSPPLKVLGIYWESTNAFDRIKK